MKLRRSIFSFTLVALYTHSTLGADGPAEATTDPSNEAPRVTSEGTASSAPEMIDARGGDDSVEVPSSSRDEGVTDVPQSQQEESAPEAMDHSEQEARAAFLEGDRLYLEGDYEGAVKAFERAYSYSGRIEMLFNLANAHERLGHYARASVALRGYIPHSPPEHRPALERRLERFEALAQERRQKDQKTAEVVKELKENPRPFPVERSVGIGLVTLGGASIVTGVVFGFSALAARGRLNESCDEGSTGRLCSPDAEKDLDRDRTHSTVADVAIIGGAIGAAVGTVILIRSKRKEKQKLELELGVSPGRVSVGGAF